MTIKIVLKDVDDLKSLLGEGFHTAFRKAVDSQRSVQMWKLISDMPRDDWGAVLDFVVSGLSIEEEV